MAHHVSDLLSARAGAGKKSQILQKSFLFDRKIVSIWQFCAVVVDLPLLAAIPIITLSGAASKSEQPM